MKNTLKRRVTAALTAVVILAAATVPALAAGAGSVKYVHTTRLATNLDYINTVYWHDNHGREESYALRYTPGGDAFPLVIKDDTVYGAVNISSALSYAENTRGRNVLAAANADFFASSTGIPLGIYIEDGEYKSSNEVENAIIFRADGTAEIIETPRVTINLHNETNATVTSVNHLNKNRYVEGVPYLFSSAFSTVSTRATTPGWCVRFRILEGSLKLGGTMRLEVAETLETEGAVPIGEEYLLLAAGGAVNATYERFSVGDLVTLELEVSHPSLLEAQFAAGAGDLLIRDGAITDSAQWDRPLLARSPKTAVGITAAGEVVVYAIDGRNTNYGNGIRLTELAEEMRELGCVTAVNLDGGGSTVMAVRQPGQATAAVVNRPSDGSPRRVSTYIAFATENVSDGVARNLALKNSGTIVLAGSSVELHITATDSAYRYANTYGDIYAVSGGLGDVERVPTVGSVYTAGYRAGADRITLFAAEGGASGTGEIYVITSPTSITPQDENGRSLDSLALDPGQAITIVPLATYYRKAVTAQTGSFTFKITGDVGTITPDGVFTASAQGGQSGTLSITAGDRTTTIPVTTIAPEITAESPFEDTVGHWAEEFVSDLYGKQIVGGTTVTTFSPELNITRGDFVLMLHRAIGEPEPTELAVFSDVAESAYYAAAVAWAFEVGITTGIGDDRFAPTQQLTREQAFTFVYRAMGEIGVDVSPEFAPPLEGFADLGEVAEYAVLPTAVLTTLEIVGGADGRLMPRASLTRAQMAKILSVTLALREVEAEENPPAETPPTESTPPNENVPPEVEAVG